MARTGAVGDGDLLQTPVTDLQEGSKNNRKQHLLEFGRAETYNNQLASCREACLEAFTGAFSSTK